jgi:hypothetical protein
MDAIQQPGFNSILANASSNSFNDTTGCSTLLASITKSVDWLVFPDSLSFERCAFCLEQQVEAYNDLYEAQYPNASAEELDSLDEVNNFDTWGPLTQFEDDLNHYSFRVEIDSIVDNWLSSAQASALDFDHFPDTFVVINPAVRALLNVNGEAIIGADTIDLRNEGIPEFGQCRFLWFNQEPFDLFGGDQRIIMSIEVRSGFISNLVGRMSHFKKVNGSWKSRRLNMSLAVEGRCFDGDCMRTGDKWEKSKGYKNRRVRIVNDRIYAAWRQALKKNRSGATYNWYTNRSQATGFYINDNYTPYQWQSSKLMRELCWEHFLRKVSKMFPLFVSQIKISCFMT